MNSKMFFLKAKEEGITPSELTLKKTTNISFSLFHKELDNYSMSTVANIKARGIFNGKLGFVSTEDLSKNNVEFLISGIKTTASLIEKTEEPIIFKGSEKYHKKNLYSTELKNTSLEKKIAKLHELEDLIYSLDKRITDVECGYQEEDTEKELTNSYGLKLKSMSNYFGIYASVVAKDGEEVQSDSDIFVESDFTKFDYQDFAKKVVNKTISKFKGTPVPSKAYRAVLSQDVVASLLGALVKVHASAESVQKHTSLFSGKLNQEILSRKITLEEKPLEKNVFFTYFDDEGVATMNKKIVNKGVLKTYLYNLETAKVDSVSSTGNGYSENGKIGTHSVNLTVKPGKLSEDELYKKIKDGVYISDVTGLHAGLNAQSGDFSLEASGFKISDGKISGALTLITVSGNILKLFNNVIAVGNNSKRLISSFSAPSIAVRELKVSAS